MKESQFKFIPETEATSPTDGQFFIRCTDAYWIVHPEKGLTFFDNRRNGYGSPQCNSNEKITRKFSEDGMFEFPHEIKFFPLVWIPFDPRDY